MTVKLLLLLLRYDSIYKLALRWLAPDFLFRIMRCEGILEVCGSGKIIGWARSLRFPDRHLEIDLYNGTELLATVIANESRPDLKRIVAGGDCFGFSYPLPDIKDSDHPLLIRAAFKGTDIELKYFGPKWIRPGEDITVNTPWAESPLFLRALSQKQLTEEEIYHVTQYREQGYMVIENAVPDDLLDRVICETEPLFDPKGPQGPLSSYRIQDAWEESEAVRELACLGSINSWLKLLYGREPLPFQTLNFKFGTQQGGHSDSIHFSCMPARFMCGAWVALEDITEENGPVFYYPGSHRLPEYNNFDFAVTDSNPHKSYEDCIEALMESQQLEKRRMLAKKGSVLIWSSNIVHGGSPILEEGRTRLSQVTHYFFDGCIYYSPLDSIPITGEYRLLSPIDIKTGRPLSHTYNGAPVESIPVGNGRSRVRF